MISALSVTSECAPLVKTGGLADVTGALPPALAAAGIAMRTLLPGYPPVMAAIKGKAQTLANLEDLFGGPARLLGASVAGLDLVVLDADHLYGRGSGIYLGPDGRDWPDNDLRFAALSWAAARIATGALAEWRPEVLHLHDWQAGLTPVYLQEMTRDGQRPATILTIHNIAFQGLTPASRIGALRLPVEGFTVEGFEYFGKISPLKAGLMLADHLTTVSPSYARELMTPEFGMGLDGVLRGRAAGLSGVLNGIDLEAWNPVSDPEIAAGYATPNGKAANKAALRATFDLAAGEGPLCVVVSRLTVQKGLDLLLEALPALTVRGGQLALLGSGDAALETAWRDAARSNPNVAVRIGYDEPLSHQMIAGGDAILVPSRFEPCGLTQMYGLRYGAVPLVTLTGGLADTVISANPAALAAGVATGLQVYPVTVQAMADGLDRLCSLFAEPESWARIQANGMAHPVGWDASAREYAKLYRSLLAVPAAA